MLDSMVAPRDKIMKLEEAANLANKHQNLKDREVETKLGQRKIQDIFISPNNQEAFSEIISVILLKESYNHVLGHFKDDETFQVYVLYYNQNVDSLAFYELLKKVVDRIESDKQP